MKTLCWMTLVVKLLNNNILLRKRPFQLAFFCVFTLLLIGCEPETQFVMLELEGQTMGTTYNIKARANHRTIITEQALQIQIDKVLEDFNEIMSTYIEDSELSLLNKSAVGEWSVVSKSLFDLLVQSRAVSADTDGAFDVTVGLAVNRWGFGPIKDQSPVTEAEITQLIEKIGYQNIELNTDSREVRKVTDIYIDLSAIAKGYATDVLADKLSEFGFMDFMIEIGGEVYVAGKNAQDSNWVIGIEYPTLAHTGAMQAIGISNTGLATSGDYRNYIERDGQRVSHTIDPSTARPITHRLASVSVVAESGALADAYATALNVMGDVRGYEFAIEKGLAAYFIIREGDTFNIKYTPKFEQLMVEL